MADTIQERKAIDFSHHLSELARSRPVSPLKGLMKYWGKPGMISMAGGLPSPEYFPFAALHADALVKDSYPIDADAAQQTSWFWRLFSSSGAASDQKGEQKTTRFTVPKYGNEDKKPGGAPAPELSSALQYSMASGLPAYQEFVLDFSKRVYQPGYDDFTVLAHTGNTDGWTRAALTLMNRGEGFLTEEWTYPSTIAAAAPYGIKAVGVTIDEFGMCADALRETLANWDPATRGGMPRPHVMYTVTVGQNPTGANMIGSRKKVIYDICVEYDVIIVEDEPYFFQQYGNYKPGVLATDTSAKSGSVDGYIKGLMPSYLKFDYQGRVVRLDTFSKTVAPGSRLGWFTCNPQFAERFMRQGETTTQAPCGFGQALVTQLLLTWKFDGYIRWLEGISEQYRVRRDDFIGCLAREFELVPAGDEGHGVRAWRGRGDVLCARAKVLREGEAVSEKRVFGRRRYFSFVPPSAGMFVWMKLHFEDHPKLLSGGEDEESLEMKLWVELAEAGVLFSPGWFFAADGGMAAGQAPGAGHFRVSFSTSTAEEMRKASEIFARVLEGFFTA